MTYARPKTASPALRWLALLAVAGALGACATGPRLVRTEVTAYNDWQKLPADKSYAFVRTLEYRDSLEMKSYEDMVRDELELRGFKPAADPDRAQLAVTLRPSTIGARVRIRDPWPMEPFGWRHGPGFGGWYGRGPFGWYDPFWAYPDAGFGYTVDVRTRRLEIDIDSRTAPVQRYYEGRVETTVDPAATTTVVPALIRALFADFPGNNGQTRRVDVPADRK